MSDITRESLWCDVTNSSHRMTEATMQAYRIRLAKHTESGTDGYARAIQCSLTVRLLHGFSGKDHLFDRTCVLAEELARKLPVDKIKLPWTNGRPCVAIREIRFCPSSELRNLPEFVQDALAALDESHRAKLVRKAAKKRKAMLASCKIVAVPARLQSGYITFAGPCPEGWKTTKYPAETFGGISGHVYFVDCDVPKQTCPAGFMIICVGKHNGFCHAGGFGPTMIRFASRREAETALENASRD